LLDRELIFNKIYMFTKRKYPTSGHQKRNSSSEFKPRREGSSDRGNTSRPERDTRTWSKSSGTIPAGNRAESSDRPSYGARPSRDDSKSGSSFGSRSSYSADRGRDNRGFGGRSDRSGSSYGGRSGGFNRGGRSGGGRSGGGRGNRFEGKKIGHEKYIATSETMEQINKYVASTSFDDLPIDSKIKANIAVKGYTHPTEIQDKTIKHIMAGKDVVGLAGTGQGKTAAFLIPLMQKALDNQETQVLIVVPTRELATQIYEEFRSLNNGTFLRAETVIGGASAYRQISGLRRNPQFVVGTPGRLKDLEDRKVLKLENFNTVVLDEVDRMLDMGFVDEIKALIGKLRSERQSLFFSATMDGPAEKIARTLLHDPVTIEIARTAPAKSVDQDIVKIGRDGSKIDKLIEIIEREKDQKILVFTKTKREADRVSDNLYDRGIKVEAIHGDKSQYIRNKVISKFKHDEINLLIATDVAARGLDIPDITLVINYDEPMTYEDYIHRIGRTGRYGKKGKALTFVD
jgi:ATP-dependent RNA helicase RhlE